MNTRFTSGFTIIEVMLFLAITGLLIAGILGGTTASLNSQRYRDGVENFRNEIRSQYETVYSLTNLNTTDAGALGSNSVDPCSIMEDDTTPLKSYRGTSNCLYVGRLIKLEPNDKGDATKVTIAPVVAKILKPAAYSGVFEVAGAEVESAQDVTDSNGLQAAVFDENNNLVTTKEIEWSLAAVNPNSDSIKSVGFFIFRSPMTGSVSTYVVDNLSPDHLKQLQEDIVIGQVKDVKLCLADLGGALDPPTRSAVIVHGGATGPGDIETLGDNSGC
jgi:type II secretory pathway pseudopilin PulG